MDNQPADTQARPEPTAPPAVQRAEVLVDIAGQRIGQFAAEAGQRLQKFFALAREEGEDMWAEAQHLRAESPLNTSRAATSDEQSPATGESAAEPHDDAGTSDGKSRARRSRRRSS